MQTLKTVFVFLEVLLLFNLLIFVHELGHFLAARWRGLKIERFAVWFGTPIWKKKIRGVEYALGTIPAGGYVSLPQMASMEMIEGKTENSAEKLPPISAMDKIIVAFAGPLFSFLLAVFFAVVVWVVGKPEPAGDAEHSTTVGWVDPTGPAGKAGLRAGDAILDIDGHKVTQFAPPAEDSVTWRIVSSEGTNIAIHYLRDGQDHMAYAQVYKRPTKWYERKALRQVLIASTAPAVIYDVATNSPAALAGLKKGDEVVAVNGQRIYNPQAVAQVEDSMTNGPIKPVTLTIRRGRGATFDKILTPEKPIKPLDSGPSLGITAWSVNTNEQLEHPSPFEQIEASAGQIVSTIRVVCSPKTDIGVQQLGGAVMIIRLYSNLFDSENGWRRVLWFSVVLNVNLALLNLLPLPVLDGGHITLALVEAIRRRPVSAKLLQVIQTTFAAILILFMLFIAFFDTSDWVRSARSNHEEPICFAPKQ
jgi:regulator of sigma E protease